MKKKIFTLLTLLLCVCSGAWAQTTGTDVIDQTGASSGTELSGTAVILPGTYIAGQGGGNITGYSPSNKGVKLRTKQTTVKVGDVTYGYVILTAKSSCTLTSFKLEGTSNDSKKTVPLKGVYIDIDTENLATSIAGATNKIAADVVFPVSGTTYGGTGEITINATSNIVLLFDSGNDYNNQMRAIITVGYEKAAETKVATPTFSPTESDFSASSLDVTIACETEDAAIQYSTDGENYMDYSEPITITGTTTVYAKATKEGLTGSDVASKTYTKVDVIDVFDASAQNATFVLTKANIKNAENGFVTTSTEDWATGKTYGGYSGDFYNMSSTGRNLTMKVSGASTFEVYVQNSTANRTYTIKVGDGDAQTITHGGGEVESSGVIATGTTGEITIVMAGGGSSVYPVYIKFNPTVPITPAKEYTTFCSSSPLNFSGVDGLTAYVVTSATGGSATLQAVTDVPASTGLILKKTSGSSFDVPVGSATSLGETNNLLVGVTTATEVTAWADGSVYNYILSDGTFYRASGGTLAAGKAYLHCESNPESAGARGLRIVFADEATGINEVQGSKFNAQGGFYDLLGRKVAQPTKGLYIVNGRKVTIK